MYHDDFCGPFSPPPHTHGPNQAVQSFPIRDNCNCGEPMGGVAMECAPCGGEAPARGRECTVVPPPIPPVRYIPGMDVQEQMCNMADRVNVAINRWNQIQANCYKALDNVVGAAVNNDVYYSPDEVRYMEGYDEESSCPYAIIEAKAVDRSGRPIVCALRPAYGNVTNSGATQNITDVSFVTSAQMVITAVQATETHWAGNSVFNCNPGNSSPDDTVWICGWTRNGVLRFFRGDVGEAVLRQNRMVSAIGPVFPVLKAGKMFTEVTESIGQEAGSIQAIGWKPNGNKVFFSCGNYDAPGITPQQVAKIMQNFGCATAVITSYQTVAVTAWDTMPIAGTENVIPEGGNAADVISAPGLTGGMTFLGTLVNAPIQWNIPANCANWVITKRPPNGWCNAFTTEVANVVQQLGSQKNTMGSIMGQLKGENESISKLEYQITQNTNNINELTVKVDTFDGRISTLETGLDKAEQDIASITSSIATLETSLENEIKLRDQQYTSVTNSIAQEKAERIAADNAISASVTAEAEARKSADTVLQNNIDEEASIRASEDAKLKADIDSEATTRANADRNLQNAIEAEASARSTKDTEHETRMDALQAQEQKDVANLQGQIDSITSGDGLPIASKTKLGAIKVGKNLTIESDGTLNAVGGGEGGGDSVVAGPGITVTENETGEKVIAIDDNVVVNEDELKAVTDKITELENKQTEQAAKDAEQDGKIKDIETANNNLATDVEDIGSKVDDIGDSITNITQEITNIKDGSALPVASATTLGGVKIGANLSISEDGVLSASAGEGHGGETVAQGTGIEVRHNSETGVATVGLNAETQATLALVASKADKNEVDGLKTTVAGKADKATVDTLAESVENLTASSGDNTADIENLKTQVASNTAGVSALNSSQVAQDNRIDALEKNVDSVVTEQAAIKDEQAELQKNIESIDDTATAAHMIASDAEKQVASKVDKAGDTMTGNLQMNGSNIALADSTGSVYAHIEAITDGIGVRKDPVGDIIIRGIATPTIANEATPKSYVDAADNANAQTAQNALTTAQDADAKAEEAKTLAQEAKDAAAGISPGITQAQADARYLQLNGGTMSGTINMAGSYGINVAKYITFISSNVADLSISSDIGAFVFGADARIHARKGTARCELIVDTPTTGLSAATKDYVDTSIQTAVTDSWAKTYTGRQSALFPPED